MLPKSGEFVSKAAEQDLMLTIPTEDIKRLRFFDTIVYKICINIEEAFGIVRGNTSVFWDGEIRGEIGEFAVLRQGEYCEDGICHQVSILHFFQE